MGEGCLYTGRSRRSARVKLRNMNDTLTIRKTVVCWIEAMKSPIVRTIPKKQAHSEATCTEWRICLAR